MFIPQIINTLDLEIGNYGQDFNKIWNLLFQQYPRPSSFNMFIKVEEAVPKKWRFYIRENPDVAVQQLKDDLSLSYEETIKN